MLNAKWYYEDAVEHARGMRDAMTEQAAQEAMCDELMAALYESLYDGETKLSLIPTIAKGNSQVLEHRARAAEARADVAYHKDVVRIDVAMLGALSHE